MSLCTIGPVTITDAHLYDGNTFNYSNSATQTVASGSTITSKGQYTEEHGFDIICTNSEAIQLKGVVEMGEIVWMDTSNELTDNDYLQHKGWVVLTALMTELLNPNMVQCTINYIKISAHENEYLTMDYSRGIYDGLNITPTYTIASTSYQLQEDGSDATTNWSTARDYPTGGTATWATDGAEFDFTNASATDGTWKNTWVIVDTKKFTPPFTVSTIFDRNTLPGAASYPASLGIMFSPNNVADNSSEFSSKALGDYLEVQWNLSNASTSMHIAEIAKFSSTGGKATFMRSGINLGTAAAECGLIITFYADGKIRVWTDIDTTGTWTQQYYGPSNLVNYKGGLYLYLMVKNRDSTSYTGSFQEVNVYNSNALTFPNVVQLPYNATPVTTPTGTRAGEDGNISYYTNPTTELRYTIPVADYYKGSVKLLSTNNKTSTSRQVYSTDTKLTPTTTTLKNAFTQLTFDADEVIISGWNAGAWHQVNKIHFADDIDFIRPLFINSERVVLQINGTKWTMLRSSPVVTVEHPNTELQYTRYDTHYHEGGTVGNPFGAGADVTMLDVADGYWMTTYDAAADTYQLLVVKKDPTTIKSNSIPADTKTGIGWALKGAAGIDTPASLAQQWYKQTRTGISLKQII